jgi:hypothetical protein
MGRTSGLATCSGRRVVALAGCGPGGTGDGAAPLCAPARQCHLAPERLRSLAAALRAAPLPGTVGDAMKGAPADLPGRANAPPVFVTKTHLGMQHRGACAASPACGRARTYRRAWGRGAANRPRTRPSAAAKRARVVAARLTARPRSPPSDGSQAVRLAGSVHAQPFVAASQLRPAALAWRPRVTLSWAWTCTLRSLRLAATRPALAGPAFPLCSLGPSGRQGPAMGQRQRIRGPGPAPACLSRAAGLDIYCFAGGDWEAAPSHAARRAAGSGL